MSAGAETDERVAAPAAARGRPSMPADDLAWVGTICGALVLALAAWLLAPELAKLYPEPTNQAFELWRPLIRPEPLEEARSLLVLGAPFVLACAIVGFGTPGASSRSLNPLIVGAQLAAAVLLIVAVLEQPNQSGFLTDYFSPYLLSVPNLIAGVVIGLLLTAGALRWSGELPRFAVRAANLLEGRGVLAFGIALLATAVFLLPAVVTDATVGQAGPIAASHIPVQAEDYLAAVNGRTPLVDYIAQYANLLPLLLEPVLKIFHSSLTSVSIALCTLSAVALLSIFGVFRVVTRGPWTALALFLPFLALSLFPWNDNGAVRDFDGNYYGILPGRLLGPFVLAWLCAVSTRRRIPLWALFGTAGLVAINNFEFGLPALLGLIVAKAVSWDGAAPVRGRLVQSAAEAAAGLLAAAAVVCLVTLLRTGELPDPSLLTYFNRLFLRDSFGLEPMPSLGLHWALYATYVAALLTAAVRYARRAPDRTLTAMLAFAGTFGLGTALYFVGRSSQFQLMLLFPAWALALALLAWVALPALNRARGNRLALQRLLLPACAVLIGFGLMISALARVSPPWRQIDRLSVGGPGANDLLPAQRFVETRTSSGEHVLILGTSLDHRVADRAGVVNVSPINGLTALITPAEANRALDQLDESGGRLVFEDLAGPTQSSQGFYPIPELAGILRERGYRPVGEDPVSRLWLWRRAS